MQLNKCGDAGNRTLYLSHAKRALYHMSYIPNDLANASIRRTINMFKCTVV